VLHGAFDWSYVKTLTGVTQRLKWLKYDGFYSHQQITCDFFCLHMKQVLDGDQMMCIVLDKWTGHGSLKGVGK
jgi:hypothetical protein